MRKAGAAKIQHDLSKRKFMLVLSFPPPHTFSDEITWSPKWLENFIENGLE